MDFGPLCDFFDLKMIQPLINVIFSTISTRSYITMVLILWDAKLETSTLAPLGFQNLYAKTRNGNNT
jgi:hypothetical protein